jgi:hypothetical protein
MSQIQLCGVCYDSARLKGDILDVARDSQKRVQNNLNLPMTYNRDLAIRLGDADRATQGATFQELLGVSLTSKRTDS